MPTQTKENYLKALYHLSQRNQDVSITDLGKELAVSKPTVNDMVKKLKAKGWVKYQKYKPLRLTDRGRTTAAVIIRKHRLAEMFLSQVMGFGWEQVHDMAEELEHISSDILFKRMDEMLGFPKFDPHGSPIPDENGAVIEKEYESLSQIPLGVWVQVSAIRDSSMEFLTYLNKKEIALGTQLVLKHKESFDQSVTVDYGARVNEVLSRSVTDRLLVERL
jgi:DtxR family Mn-dependent transcriptional regulator